MWVEYVRFMRRCVLLDGVIKVHIDARGTGVHWICYLIIFFQYYFLYQLQTKYKQRYFIKKWMCCLWAVGNKGHSLQVNGQFQGPEIPIGSLLSLIGWEILMNEMYLDSSWWIHSAANLNPSTNYGLESHSVWFGVTVKEVSHQYFIFLNIDKKKVFKC